MDPTLPGSYSLFLPTLLWFTLLLIILIVFRHQGISLSRSFIFDFCSTNFSPASSSHNWSEHRTNDSCFLPLNSKVPDAIERSFFRFSSSNPYPDSSAPHAQSSLCLFNFFDQQIISEDAAGLWVLVRRLQASLPLLRRKEKSFIMKCKCFHPDVHTLIHQLRMKCLVSRSNWPWRVSKLRDWKKSRCSNTFRKRSAYQRRIEAPILDGRPNGCPLMQGSSRLRQEVITNNGLVLRLWLCYRWWHTKAPAEGCDRNKIAWNREKQSRKREWRFANTTHTDRCPCHTIQKHNSKRRDAEVITADRYGTYCKKMHVNWTSGSRSRQERNVTPIWKVIAIHWTGSSSHMAYNCLFEKDGYSCIA